MDRKTIIFSIFLCLCFPMLAQDAVDKIHIGVRGGTTISWANYSQIKNRDAKSVANGTWGIFAEFGFGENQVFSIRPEVDFLNRGTKISDNDLDYKLKVRYVDFRLPLILNFGNAGGIRPYVYVAPVFGFVNGGKITLDDATGSYNVKASKANVSDTYIAGALGLGVKCPVHIGNNKLFHLGIEANYQMGFTDTYSSMEKDGDAIAVNRPFYDVRGSRKLHGFEIAASVSVPLSIFKRAPKKKVEPVYVPEPVVEVQPEPVVEEEKPCYTLEEILEMLKENKSVVGKTICAVDMINFEFDKSVIKAESYPYLNKIADLLKNTSMHIVIKGHTDNVGNAEYNMELSKKRAEAVYRYLLKNGADAGRLKYEYYGMTRPIASNDTEEGRLTNRRVEFEITE